MDENTGRIVAPASAGDSEASPRPWRVERGEGWISIVDAAGVGIGCWSTTATRPCEADVALIVAAVNACRPPSVRPGEIISPLPCKTSRRLAHRIPGLADAVVLDESPKPGATLFCAMPA